MLLIFTAKAAVTILKPKHTKIADKTEQTSFPSPSSNNFYENIYFGGSPSGSYELPEPPKGNGLLKGRITYEGQPAEAILLHIVLNSKYRASNVLTDSDGIFTIKLPVGEWNINSIQTESWQNKPENDFFSIYYGGESKLIGNHFDQYTRLQSSGYRAEVGENVIKPQINIVIKNDIELIWPDANKIGVDATISDTIQWRPYPSAAKYFIKIQHLRRKGTTTYFEPITSKVISGETSFPLSTLQHVRTNGAKNLEYAVELFAFSEDGTLLGQASDTFRGGTFILTDGNVFVEDKLQDLFDPESGEDPDSFPEKMAQIAKDKDRIDAVKVLIEENMLAEAGILLEKVNSKLAKGEKEVLSGYLFAMKGNCSEAKMMFEKAWAVNPDVCIPDSYKGNCE
jgi:hypothetical protein